MSAHTPGPWTIQHASKSSDGGTDYAILSPSNGIIGEAFEKLSHTHKEPAYENARLMAAAPELLAALSIFMTVKLRPSPVAPDDLGMARHVGRAAITKARGSN